jgi:NTE family protein
MASKQITLGEWLADGPYTLSLSSGFFGFFAHAGVLAALRRAGLAPTKASGASAGALVAGCWAAGLEAEDIREALFGVRRADFWDPAPGLGLLRGVKFERHLRRLIGDAAIENARAPLAISVYDVWRRGTAVLTSGDLCSAIRASCAVPLMFHPVRRAGRLLLDGGIADRPGLAGVGGGERILYHHLRSRRSWRRLRSGRVALPRRERLAALVLNDLPAVGPNALDQGRLAYAHALALTTRALDQSFDESQPIYV